MTAPRASHPGTARKKQRAPAAGAALAVVAVVAVVAALLAAPATAWAHEDGEAEEGYLLVQQALAHIAHDTSTEGIHEAMEKVEDALETVDQEGVDVAEVEDAMAALEAGDVDMARDLLQDSIEEALHDRPLATGTKTGTTLVLPETSGRSGVDGPEWAFLITSMATLLLGGWLALRFRPRDRLRDLRRTLAHAGTGEDASPPDTRRGGGS